MNERYVIDCKGLLPGVDRAVEWKVGDGFWHGRENCEVTGSDVRVRARRVIGTAISGSVELEVEINGVATMPCDRCLDDCELPVSFSEKVRMECEGGEVDMAQYIYESIILGLPFSKVHARREDCNPEMLKKIITEE